MKYGIKCLPVKSLQRAKIYDHITRDIQKEKKFFNYFLPNIFKIFNKSTIGENLTRLFLFVFLITK